MYKTLVEIHKASNELVRSLSRINAICSSMNSKFLSVALRKLKPIINPDNEPDDHVYQVTCVQLLDSGDFEVTIVEEWDNFEFSDTHTVIITESDFNE